MLAGKQLNWGYNSLGNTNEIGRTAYYLPGVACGGNTKQQKTQTEGNGRPIDVDPYSEGIKTRGGRCFSGSRVDTLWKDVSASPCNCAPLGYR